MNALNNYLRISSFLEGYLCEEMLLAVSRVSSSEAELGPHSEKLSEYSLYKDVLYECSASAATEMLCRNLNIRELAYISEKIEGYLLENGY